MNQLSPKAQWQVDSVFLVLLLTGASSVATQFTAWRFNYHPALGRPWFDQIYAPWGWLTWQIQFGKQGPQTFALVNMFCILVVGAIVYSYCLLRTMRARSGKGHAGVHGTARFADVAMIRKTGLLTKPGQTGRGVYVGGWTDAKGRLHYLRHDGPEHVAAIAPTRSGKGVGLVVPTLLSWPHSTVIHDMKGELWHLTAGYRQKGLNNVVLKFDPAAETGSCSFNPLAEVRLLSRNAIGDVQNLVTIIVDPDGKGLVDHWAKTAHAFLTGVTLYLLFKAKRDGKPPACLSELAMALSGDIQKLYDAMRQDDYMPDLKRPEQQMAQAVIVAAAQDMLNRPEQERGSVLSSAMSYLSLYRDPLVAENTRSSSFKIQDLKRHDQPVSLYLVVRPADKDRLKPLMRLVLNQIVRTLTREEVKPASAGPEEAQVKNHRLLLMLDEFPSFGKLEVFQEALAFIAGYGIKAYLIMQDIAQLQAAYGANESIIANCHIRVAYAPNNIKTAEWLSKMLGQTTVVRKETTVSGKRMGGMLKNVSESYHSTGRPLMTPDEIMTLPMLQTDIRTGQVVQSGEMLIFVAGHAPIKGTQILYFRDPWFSEVAKVPPPSEQVVLVPPHNAVLAEKLPEASQQEAPPPEAETETAPKERPPMAQVIGLNVSEDDESTRTLSR